MNMRSDSNTGYESGTAAFDPVRWLYLAATPVFALMALLTGLIGAGPTDVLCGQGALSLTGMVPMYGLMSAFHAGPWIRVILGR